MRIIAALVCSVIATSAGAQTLSPSSNPNSITGNLTITGKYLSSAADSVTVPIYSSTQDATTGMIPRNGRIDFVVGGTDVFEIIGAAPNIVLTTGSYDGVSYQSTGSPPSNSGTCAVTSQVGGNSAGSFIASGACAGGTYIFGFATLATNGWSCDAEDRTTITDTVQQQASTVTNATFKATTASADVVSWKCMSY